MSVDPRVLACPKCGEPRANHIHVEGLRELWPTRAHLVAQLERRVAELRQPGND